ncbi:LacI family DNA-binding transcriptional regulator [Paenibacillus sp. GCM10027626]|uniref:LacI family DNA-binding transcriptional regulator n=1 Tax=Paenibacillus sp. GCM10027626 TaxID=3273411 RepID=UPI00362CE05E
MKVSIFDVAKKSGLSVVTVSRVLNNSPSVRPHNRERVIRAMQELDYHPNASARSLARGSTGIIGMMITTLNDSFLDAVVKEVNDLLEAKGYFLALSISTGEPDAYHKSLFQEDRVDGVLLLSPMYEEEYVLELKRNKIPFVLLDNQQRNPSAVSVMVDNFKGGYEATKHLIDLGHTDIAHISGPELFLSSRERERGYREALKDHGVQPFCVERGDFEIASGYRIARKWLAAERLPTAIFAADDYIALGVIDALKGAGIAVPQSVSVIGFDDQILASEFHPQLSTVRQPAEQMGKIGVELLLRSMNSALRRGMTTMLEPELVIRESTSPRLGISEMNNRSNIKKV